MWIQHIHIHSMCSIIPVAEQNWRKLKTHSKSLLIKTLGFSNFKNIRTISCGLESFYSVG